MSGGYDIAVIGGLVALDAAHAPRPRPRSGHGKARRPPPARPGAGEGAEARVEHHVPRARVVALDRAQADLDARLGRQLPADVTHVCPCASRGSAPSGV